ncbi:Methyltransferase domain-containing protein [Frankineae bacterium MT45]|nr:Methyltransferase domain-containing protein [Frankineae bacterium MT45]
MAIVVAVPDAIFADPMLARVYDAFEGDRRDLSVYLDLVGEVGSRQVLDVGCGTGSLAVLLAVRGFDVTGVDPAAASLEIAGAKEGADRVAWIHGDATTLPPMCVDTAVMTGNVAQVFLDDHDWLATLRGIRTALNATGHLIFESRRPERRVWEDWARDSGPVVRDVRGIGEVEQRSEVAHIDLPYVSFRKSYRFTRTGAVISSVSTLRFRSRAEIEDSLNSTGFTILQVRNAPDRPQQENVFIARRSPEP